MQLFAYINHHQSLFQFSLIPAAGHEAGAFLKHRNQGLSEIRPSPHRIFLRFCIEFNQGIGSFDVLCLLCKSKLMARPGTLIHISPGSRFVVFSDKFVSLLRFREK